MTAKRTQEEQRELTGPQREFCRLVAGGETIRAAYLKAYGCKESAAAQNGSRLMKRDYIKAEISRLTEATRKEIQRRGKEHIGAKADRMQMLWQMAQEAARKGDVQAAVGCIREMNKMDGAYEPEKLDVRAEMGVVGIVAAIQEEGCRLPVAPCRVVKP